MFGKVDRYVLPSHKNSSSLNNFLDKKIDIYDEDKCRFLTVHDTEKFKQFPHKK